MQASFVKTCFFSFNLMVLVFFLPRAIASPVFIETDLGTSYSPHGQGISAGIDFDNFLLLLGTGYSKHNKLGWPISLEFINVLYGSSYRESDSPFIGLRYGVNYYGGKGVRRVVQDSFPDGVSESVRWELHYVQLGLEVGKTTVFGTWFVSVGVASNTYSRLEPDRSNFDYSNLSDPKGIDVDPYPGTYAGQKDKGLFLRCGIRINLI